MASIWLPIGGFSRRKRTNAPQAFNDSRMFRNDVSLRSTEYPRKFICRLRRVGEVLFTFYGSGAYGATP